MEELLEMITWFSLGIHSKPIGIMNADKFYDSLLSLFDVSIREGFIKPFYRQLFVDDENIDNLAKKLECFQVPPEFHPVWKNDASLLDRS